MKDVQRSENHQTIAQIFEDETSSQEEIGRAGINLFIAR
jgi:hypothetical protein